MALTNYSKAKKTKGNTESTENIFMKDSFFIKEEHLYIKVKFDDILWIKADGNYLDLHTQGKTHIVRAKLSDFLQQLPAPKFFQVHRSYAINVEAVDTVEPTTVHIGEDEIPVGRKFRDALFELLHLPK